MKRKKRSVYLSDEEYQLVASYAASKGRDASNFIRYAVLSEIRRHASESGKERVNEERVKDGVRGVFPATGEAIERD